MSISDFADMFFDTLTHTDKAGSDDYGAPIYAGGDGYGYGVGVLAAGYGQVEYGSGGTAPTTYTARIQYKQALKRNKQGQEVVVDGNVLIMGTPDIKADDKVTLSNGDTPVIISVERHEDEKALHHTRVFFSNSRGLT